MAERAGLFEDGGDIDLSGFTPKKSVKAEPAEAVRAVAEGANFQSREPAPRPPNKVDRHYRTGRNRPLATKISQQAEKLLYSIRDAHKDTENWTLGEIIEYGLQAFQRELDSSKAKE